LPALLVPEFNKEGGLERMLHATGDMPPTMKPLGDRWRSKMDFHARTLSPQCASSSGRHRNSL